MQTRAKLTCAEFSENAKEDMMKLCKNGKKNVADNCCQTCTQLTIPPFHTTPAPSTPPQTTPRQTTPGVYIYLFGVLRRFQHCTGHITMGSWKSRGNQYIQLVKVLYCKLLTNGKKLPAFPLEAVPGTEPWSQRWETRVLPLCHRGPLQVCINDYCTVMVNWCI